VRLNNDATAEGAGRANVIDWAVGAATLNRTNETFQRERDGPVSRLWGQLLEERPQKQERHEAGLLSLANRDHEEDGHSRLGME
jgi:hypothetical protein